MTSRIRPYVVVATVLMLAACAAPVRGTPASVPALSPPGVPVSGDKPPPRYTPAVRSPLDARGIPPCDLLTERQLIELNLLPATAKPGGTEGAAQTCTWTSSVDPANPGGLQVRTESPIPVLDGLFIVRDSLAVFEPTEVSGHPAYRADGTTLTGCRIYTAIADYQGVATGTNPAGRKLADPCAGARRMAEMILSNLPPLR
ncbi:DUF3558 domain-containing protein [Pseudonocardia sp. 73-21]|uniref:DUF3558 domain-containing protein n=1 Tax=Pseudonocardia sp. 73-21 TaxID=1895809 RepID=UPI00260D1DA3|nr:DUF3558 domain-containing protein [Pseudonocardia sp. 73-21]